MFSAARPSPGTAPAAAAAAVPAAAAVATVATAPPARPASPGATAPTPLTPEAVIARLRHLPPMPAIVTDLLAAIETPDMSVAIIAGKMGRDQALAARALRLANSSFFGLRTQAVTMRDAINVLGLGALRTLVAAAAVVGQLRPAAGSSFDFEAFWRHSIATACAAGQLARRTRADAHAAFMAGLLHDIGRLVLVTCFPAQYEEVIRRRREFANTVDAENAIFSLDHVHVGVALAQHWNFPDVIGAAIRGHHDTFADGPVTLAELVSVADCAARAMGCFDDVDDMPAGEREGEDENEAIPGIDRLGIGAVDFAALLEAIRGEVDSITAILASSR